MYINIIYTYMHTFTLTLAAWKWRTRWAGRGNSPICQTRASFATASFPKSLSLPTHEARASRCSMTTRASRCSATENDEREGNGEILQACGTSLLRGPFTARSVAKRAVCEIAAQQQHNSWGYPRHLPKCRSQCHRPCEVAKTLAGYRPKHITAVNNNTSRILRPCSSASLSQRIWIQRVLVWRLTIRPVFTLRPFSYLRFRNFDRESGRRWN